MRGKRFAGKVAWKVTEADFGEAVPMLEGVMICPRDNMLNLQLTAVDEHGEKQGGLGMWLTPDEARELARTLNGAATRAHVNSRYPKFFRSLGKK